VAAFRTRYIETRDGARLRAAVWDEAPATPRGLCVVLGGQTEFLEKYEEVAGELAARAFLVATFDWRGQGGSDHLLPDPLKVHIRDFAQYDEDLRAFLDQVAAPLAPGPPLALAHSMGGHVLTRLLHDRPGAIAAAVLSAPMMRAQTRGYPPLLARLVCRAQNLAGQGSAWVWGMAGRDPLTLAFEDNLVTSDRGRFDRNRTVLAAHGELRTAGPSWGWLEAAFRAMARASAPGFAEAIATPVLVVDAGRDRIVDAQAGLAFAGRLPHGSHLCIAESQHEILMETDSVRAAFWAAFDGFVAQDTRA
jgi:lysophospholipase